ncbi:hypothetical protein [Clostridium sp. 1001271B_151109_B4]|uniref:hypothetical protein n=1 Tax=Clostridium sp. 1001271B_151109_B4 TaxID=2787148 RepID=UPI0018ABC952|nr:hypothetical protein [Clostridium sp. 1001271B_151109_B4]
MKSIYKRYSAIVVAGVVGASIISGPITTFAQENKIISKFITRLNLRSSDEGNYSTNATGVGQYKTINSISDWTEDMIIAQGVANDDARIFRGSHEGPVYDTYALYGAWDDNNLYLMWQFVNVTDVVDPAQNYPISDNGKPYNGDIPQILAFSIGPNKSGDGTIKKTDSKTGVVSYDENVWGVRVNYETKVDTLMYFSSKPGVGQPAIFKVEDDSCFNYDTAVGFKEAGVSFKYDNGFLGNTMLGIKDNGWAGYTPDDLYDSASNWVNMLDEGHDTKQDTMYSMTIPLESLGIDRDYIQNNGIGVMHISTFGQSGIASLPHDKSMLDVATEEYGPDSSTSAEKEDYDVITESLARIGKKEISENNKIDITNIKTDKESGNVGSEVKITAESKGGKDVVYSMSVHEIKDGWRKISDFSDSNTTTWVPTKKGKYKIWVDAKDSSNNKASGHMDYTVN